DIEIVSRFYRIPHEKALWFLQYRQQEHADKALIRYKEILNNPENDKNFEELKILLSKKPKDYSPIELPFHIEIVLNNKDRDKFIESLENPSKPNEELKKLLQD